MKDETLKGVYYVKSEEDPSALIALNVRINSEQKTISWLDTVKERIASIKNLREFNAKEFDVETIDDRNYHFQPLTLNIYNETVKDRLATGREFETEDEMIAAFEETKKNIW